MKSKRKLSYEKAWAKLESNLAMKCGYADKAYRSSQGAENYRMASGAYYDTYSLVKDLRHQIRPNADIMKSFAIGFTYGAIAFFFMSKLLMAVGWL